MNGLTRSAAPASGVPYASVNAIVQSLAEPAEGAGGLDISATWMRPASPTLLMPAVSASARGSLAQSIASGAAGSPPPPHAATGPTARASTARRDMSFIRAPDLQ